MNSSKEQSQILQNQQNTLDSFLDDKSKILKTQITQTIQEKKLFITLNELEGDKDDIMNSQNVINLSQNNELQVTKDFDQTINQTMPINNITEEDYLKHNLSFNAKISNLKDYNINIDDSICSSKEIDKTFKKSPKQNSKQSTPKKQKESKNDESKQLQKVSQNSLSEVHSYQSKFSVVDHRFSNYMQQNKNISNRMSYFTDKQNQSVFPQKKETLLKKTQQKEHEKNIELAQQMISKVLLKSQTRKDRINNRVKEFIQNLQIRSNLRKINKEMIEKNMIEKIKDKIYFQTQRRNVNIFNGLLPFCEKYIFSRLNIQVFLPTSTFQIAWDILIIVFSIIFLYIFSITIYFAFDIRENFPIRVLQNIAWVLFLLDILINFNTAYFNKDNIVTDRISIAHKYFSSTFLSDIMSFSIIFWKVMIVKSSFSYNPDHEVIPLLINNIVFLKAFSVISKRKRVEDVINLSGYKKLLLKLVYQLHITIISAHLGMIYLYQQQIYFKKSWFYIVSIIWHELAIVEQQYNFEITWMKKANIENSYCMIRYVYSFYWAVTTMSTIGYGDITPTNVYEAFFTTINMIFLSCVFAYSINNIGMILQEIEKESEQLKQNISVIQRFLSRKNVNLQLKSRIRHYLYSLAKEQRERNKQEEDKVFSQLSNKLREEITHEVNSQIINNYPNFCKLFSQSTLKKMVLAMKEVIINPNEVIFKDNQVDDCAIYFIEGGKIEIFNNLNNSQPHILKVLNKNELFGDLSFFSGLARKASARSLNLSTLYILKRNEFIDIIKENSLDFEKFKMIQEQITVLKDFSSINMKCYTCSQSTHISQNCPYTSQYFDSQFIILKNLFTISQTRRFIQRKKYLRYHAMDQMNLSNNQECKELLINNADDLGSWAQLALFDSEQESEKTDSDGYSDNDSVLSSQNQDKSGSKANSFIQNQTQGQSYITNNSMKINSEHLNNEIIKTTYDQQKSDYKFDLSQSKKVKLEKKNSIEVGLTKKISQFQQTKSDFSQFKSVLEKGQSSVVNKFEKKGNQKKKINFDGVNQKRNAIDFNGCEEDGEDPRERDQSNYLLPVNNKLSTLLPRQYSEVQKQQFSFQTSPKENQQKLDNQLQQSIIYSEKSIQNFKDPSNSPKDKNTISKEDNFEHNQRKSVIKKHKKATFTLLGQNLEKENLQQQSAMLRQRSKSQLDRSVIDLNKQINDQAKKILLNGDQQQFMKSLSPSLLIKLLTMLPKGMKQNQDLNGMFDLGQDSESNIDDNFDRIKNFRNFFIHNNFEKIQHDIKIKKARNSNIQIEPGRKKQKSSALVKRDNQIRKVQKNNKIQESILTFLQLNLQIECDQYIPTALSYGVGIKGNKIYPCKYEY